MVLKVYELENKGFTIFRNVGNLPVGTVLLLGRLSSHELWPNNS